MSERQPYYVTDIVPTAPRSWTIHGAWSHRSEVWKMIVDAGLDAYTAALEKVMFYSNGPLGSGPKDLHSAQKRALDMFHKEGVPFKDVAEFLWREEKRRSIGTDQ